MCDRDKAINGLESTMEFLSATKNMFKIGFPNIVSDVYDKALDSISDALALLKAQEPHIVTIADYVNNPIVDKDGNLAVWRESRHLNGIAYHNDGWVILNRNRVEGWFNSEMIRFWTSRPTDEQREAVKW